MINDEAEPLRTLTASFSTTINQQTQRLEDGMRSVSQALDKAANRLGAIIPAGATPPAGGTPATATPATPAAPVTGPLTIAGIVSVKVVNDGGAVVPVLVTNQEPPPSGGILPAIGSGIGNFFGSLFGSVFNAAALPWIGLADLAIAVTGIITVLAQVNGILGRIRDFARELVDSVRGLITLLFDELTAAGIFPVSRLVASLLLLIDRGATVVLMHIQPLLVWVESVLKAVTTWLGTLINALTRYLATYLAYLVGTVLRPAVDVLVRDALRAVVSTLSSVLFGWITALGAALVAGSNYLDAVLTRQWIEFRNALPFATPVPLPPEPKEPDWKAILKAGAEPGSAFGEWMTVALLGPAPPQPEKPKPGKKPPPSKGRRAGAPHFDIPELNLPLPPGAAPELEQALTTPPATAQATVPAQAPVAVQGGITVQITAETVSMENAEATARAIAEHLRDELARLAQADRFGRGLATSGVH